jgi:(p)ppGpp synthase/HD superfamily hydrolase
MNLEKAIKIAVQAHGELVDKRDNPHILHPFRVMVSFETEDERIFGVLHNAVEDSVGWTWHLLREAGCTDEIITALQSVSKTAEEENFK